MATLAEPVRSRPRRQIAAGVAAVFCGYALVSFLFFGVRLLLHGGPTLIGDLYEDPPIFVWSFAWWPHAILHGQNPFFTRALWAPSGFNLAWATSVPALALAFAPLTLAFGAVASYNTACILMPALAATTAFALCRHLTRSFWPSLLGGYLFGFSSYILGGTIDHIHTVAVFLLPLVALVCVRFLEGGLSARALVLELGALLALQAYISTEVLFALTLALAAALVLALAFAPALRTALRRLAVLAVPAYAVAALLTAPLAYYVLTGYAYRPAPGAEVGVVDALNFVVPTQLSFGGWWSSGIARHFPALIVEQTAYLGLPVLVIVAWFGLRHWRTPSGRFLVASFLVAAVAALGSWLTVDGRRLTSLPWLHLSMRPLFENVTPARFTVFSALAAAVIAAMWAASTGPRRSLRVAVAVLAVVAVAPNLAWRYWARTPYVPALFATRLYRSYLHKGETILPLPQGALGDSLLWQVDSGFWFRIAGGYISPAIPAPFEHPPAVQQIVANDLPPKITSASIRRFVELKNVTAVVLDDRNARTWKSLLAPLARPESVGGVLIYRLHEHQVSRPRRS